MNKPQLIDELIREYTNGSQSSSKCGDKWYIAKDELFYGLSTLPERIYHAWLVIRGKARAYRFKQDDQ